MACVVKIGDQKPIPRFRSSARKRGGSEISHARIESGARYRRDACDLGEQMTSWGGRREEEKRGEARGRGSGRGKRVGRWREEGRKSRDKERRKGGGQRVRREAGRGQKRNKIREVGGEGGPRMRGEEEA
eukprot:2820116-Pleurochrysis_carterae.AAC.1